MPSRRTIQVGILIQEELCELLRRELKDPGLGFITITQVEVSPDLRSARVHFSVLGAEEVVRQSRDALGRASGFLRRELGRRLTLRHVPELQFVLDRSMERAQRISDLLREIQAGEASPGGE